MRRKQEVHNSFVLISCMIFMSCGSCDVIDLTIRVYGLDL